jgi:hypothetical protein
MFSSPDFVRKIRSRQARLERHIAHMRNMRYAFKILDGNPKGRDLDVNRKIILRWISIKLGRV